MRTWPLQHYHYKLRENRILDSFSFFASSEVVGVSVDSKFSHLAWINTPRKQGGLGGGLKIPLVADLTKSISRKYGCLMEDAGHTYRGLYIINPKGVLVQATLNDAPVGRNVDETLRLVQAFQFVDEHGEVCPVNWTVCRLFIHLCLAVVTSSPFPPQPGSATMKADPKGSLSYFEKVNQ